MTIELLKILEKILQITIKMRIPILLISSRQTTDRWHVTQYNQPPLELVRYLCKRAALHPSELRLPVRLQVLPDQTNLFQCLEPNSSDYCKHPLS